jgi:DNA-binding transcriptional regulator YiaG
MAHKQTAHSFWEKVKKKAGCWEWRGACNSSGYGVVSWRGKRYTAHRVAAWLVGLVTELSAPANPAEKTHVLHKCDNRKCCNPKHFFVGSYTDNQIDAYRKKRREQPRGEAHANAKLTDKQATEIRRVYTVHGLSQQTLANRYDVSQTAISKIIRGETY